MKVLRLIEEVRAFSRAEKRNGRSVALVPTMGYLHDGHMSLVAAAKEAADVVIVSIFVNPTQFGAGEDLDKYPRDVERDLELCRSAGVDAVFLPEASIIYPENHATSVEVDEKLTGVLCGRFRPGHFRGVTTVVSILFNVCEPDVAVFGQKDAQQAIVIEKMCLDLHFPVKIIVSPIIREKDGLALSSRNTYLTPEEREQAPVLKAALDEAVKMYDRGERDSAKILSCVKAKLATAPLARPQYVELVDARNLKPVEKIDSTALLALAVFFGSTRLIDNVILAPDNLE